MTCMELLLMVVGINALASSFNSIYVREDMVASPQCELAGPMQLFNTCHNAETVVDKRDIMSAIILQDKPSRAIRAGITGLACCFLAACSATTTDSGSSQRASYATPSNVMTICSGYGCIIEDKLTLSDDVTSNLRQIMDSGQDSAPAERAALSKAIAYMETATRDNLRFSTDIEYSYQKNSGKRGQMDCVDESRNTTAFLKYLHGNGMLRYHKPIANYAQRGLLIDGRYPHKSARMKDNNGVDWAVDSWKRGNGAEPEIITLAKWYKGRNDASQY
jgi:hypothetical protein